MKIGIIGYKNQANRILECISEYNSDCEIVVFHPKVVGLNVTTNVFSDLFCCECVFVCSPNSTHFSYIKKLLENKNFLGKIFCEKPPVSNLANLKKLRLLLSNGNQDVYFNFNFRRSRVSNMLKNEFDLLGHPIQVNLSLTHGLAFKSGYLNSWRSKKELHPLGVLETVGVHWIDLFINLFGRVDDYKIFNSIVVFYTPFE